MKISEIMNTDVISILFDATLDVLEDLLTSKCISGVPVLSADGELMGIVSKTDVIRRFSEDSKLFKRDTRVWEIMTPDVIWASVDDDITTVAQRMVEARVHRVLVYNGETVAGIVASFDFVRNAAVR